MGTQTPKSDEMGLQAGSAGDFQFPAGSEQRLLDRLALLDLKGASEPQMEIVQFLETTAPQDLRSACLYSFELLCTINRLVWRGTAEEARRASHRVALVSTFSRISSASELRSAFAESFEQMLGPFRGGAAGQHPAISRAKAFIHESYHRKISLREVARYLGLSRTYLSTLFRRECGFTLTEYLHRVRLQRAQELMRGETPSLSLVAARVGYQNYRDFHRNFVRYRSTSPKKFKHELERAAQSRPPSLLRG